MTFTAGAFSRMIDATCINPALSFSSQVDLAEYCRKYEFRMAYGLSCWYDYLIENLKGSKTGVGGAVGSSLGGGTECTPTKVFQAKLYLEKGCEEIDMWMNIAEFRAAEYDRVIEDLRAVREAVPKNKILKVIIEPALLSAEQIESAVKLVVDSGADFVKAGTGLLGECTLDHARLMVRAAGGKIGVKCSGGIRDLDLVKAMADMGVKRIGLGLFTAEKIYKQLAG
jgi:deoxyribose-phosphate aldolase